MHMVQVPLEGLVDSLVERIQGPAAKVLFEGMGQASVEDLFGHRDRIPAFWLVVAEGVRVLPLAT